MGVNFSPSPNNFANTGSFAKVSVSVQLLIPWYCQGIIGFTGMKTFAEQISRDFVGANVPSRLVLARKGHWLILYS